MDFKDVVLKGIRISGRFPEHPELNHSEVRIAGLSWDEHGANIRFEHDRGPDYWQSIWLPVEVMFTLAAMCVEKLYTNVLCEKSPPWEEKRPPFELIRHTSIDNEWVE